MDKKDIYEHLAKIYLDASGKRKKKHRHHPYLRNLLFLCLGVAFSAGIFFFSARNKAPNEQIALVLYPNTAKINFSFNPAKKEIFWIDLRNLDLTRFKTISFSAKKANYHPNVSLRVEFTNSYNEKSELYIKGLPYRWQDYRLSLNQFKRISDWSKMRSISFIVEEWNATEDHGIVFIENISLIK